jgi:hypothetical protein
MPVPRAIEQADPRGPLHEANLVADPVVVVDVEADLLGVEGLRTVHVRDGDRDELESPVHEPLSFGDLPDQRNRRKNLRTSPISRFGVSMAGKWPPWSNSDQCAILFSGSIVLPALILFPVGYVLLARLLAGLGATWPGILLGVGAVVYTIGGLAIFALGPHSPTIQILEVAGALPYALGFVLLGRSARLGRTGLGRTGAAA